MTRSEWIGKLREAQVLGAGLQVEPAQIDELIRAIAGVPDQPLEVSPEVTESNRPICRVHTVAELEDPDRGHIQIVGYFETLVVPIDRTVIGVTASIAQWNDGNASVHGGGEIRLRPGERLLDMEKPGCVLHSFGATGPRPPEPDDGSPLLKSHGVVWLKFEDRLEVAPLGAFCESLNDGRLLPLRATVAEHTPLTGERVRVTPQWKHGPGSWGESVPVGAVGVLVRKGDDSARGAYVEILFREVREGLIAMSFDDFAREVRIGAIVRETIEGRA